MSWSSMLGAIGPAKDLEGDAIFTKLDELGNIELSSEARAL